MIILDTRKSKSYTNGTYDEVVVYADTKAEVPATGALTSAEMEGTPVLPPMTMLYTADLEVAILDSTDNWVWQED